jgi:general secretion pathway protein G
MFLAALLAIAETTEALWAHCTRGYSVLKQETSQPMIQRLQISYRLDQRSGAEISTHRSNEWTIARHSVGVTLIEIVIAIAIMGILSAVSLRVYDNYLYRADVAQATLDIQAISVSVSHFQLVNDGQLPDDLAAIGRGGMLDPWGNPYQYFNISTATGNGNVRKDKNLVPINSDYDLYSKGPDGKSQSPLTATASRDDIVRASNGRFVGVASDY